MTRGQARTLLGVLVHATGHALIRRTAALFLPLALQAADADPPGVKREQVFQFTEKPTVSHDGDQVKISFACKGRCDVAVAIENARGRIVRHLAAGPRFDLVTSFDAVHDTPDPAGVLARIHGVLRPGGVHRMQDIGGSARLENDLDFPFAPFLYAISCTHCTPISVSIGAATSAVKAPLASQ